MRRDAALALLIAAAPVQAQHEGHGSPGATATRRAGAGDHAADRIYGTAAMARARAILRAEHGGGRYAMLLFHLAEVQPGGGTVRHRWDAQGWYGGDFDRLVVKSEGEGGPRAAARRAEAQLLWSHAIGPYFDLQAGIRHDLGRGPRRRYAVIGVEGLAPYWFEVEAHAFLSDRGDLVTRVKAEHDLRITQRLVLQPRVEAEFAVRRVHVAGMRRDVSDMAFGLRLRYEIVREFAPYVGVQHDRGTGIVAGVRAWF